MARLIVAEQVEASWVPGHNKGVPCWSSFSPERKHWIAWHTARSQRCHSRRRLRSSSPNFNSARRSRRWLRKKKKKGETFSPIHERGIFNSTAKNSSSADSSQSPGIMQTCLPGFPSLEAEKTGKESLPFEETSSARKCQSTTSTHMVKITYRTHACWYPKWKAMLSHAWGRSCIMRRWRRWLKFLKLRHRARTDDVVCEAVLSFDVCKNTERTKRSKYLIYCDP